MYFTWKEDLFDAAVNNSWTNSYYGSKFSDNTCVTKIYLLKHNHLF